MPPASRLSMSRSELFPDARLEPARLDEDHPHAIPGDLDPERIRQCFERMLRPGVVTGEGHRREPCDRRHVDDATAPVSPHRRQREPSEPHRRVHHRLEERSRFVVPDVLHCTGHAISRVVHESVEAGRLEFGDHVLAPSGVGDVEQDGLHLDACRTGRVVHCPRLLGRADGADGPKAAPCDLHDGREPDAGVRAGRQDRSVTHRRASRRPLPPFRARRRRPRCRRASPTGRERARDS